MEQYIGDERDRDTLEMLALKIDPAHRVGEAALMRSRWFDYRDMHPALATYHYAHCYRVQTQRFFAAVIDERTAEDARAFVPDDIFFSRDLTSMWNARRQCDQLGIPYAFALRFAQDRFLSRAQRQFPRPNQLYGEEFEADLLLAWREQVARQITFAHSPRFRTDQYRGEPVQVEHLDFVCAQVLARPAPRYRLIARLLQEHVISFEQAEARFGEQAAADADRYRAQFM